MIVFVGGRRPDIFVLVRRHYYFDKGYQKNENEQIQLPCLRPASL